MSENKKLTPEEERDIIKPFVEKPLEAGEEWCVVAKRWWRRWADYAGYTRQQSPESSMENMHIRRAPRPGPIDNSEIRGKVEGELKKMISPNDYELIHIDGWNKLVEWYGGDTVYARLVITIGVSQETRVDLYPNFVYVYWSNDDGSPNEDSKIRIALGRSYNMDKLVEQAKGKREQSDEEYKSADPGDAPSRLWYKKDEEKEEKEKEYGAVADSGEEPGQNGQDNADGGGEGEGEGVGEGGGGGGEGKGEEEVKSDGWVLILDDEMKFQFDRFAFDASQEFMIEEKVDGEFVRRSNVRPWNDFQTGDVIDVRDLMNKWYESTIRDLKDDKGLLIHYNGWHARWDEWIEADSDRIAKRGTHTSGEYDPRSRNMGSSWRSYNESQEGAPDVNGVVGLRNLGNTCFMNSTLQCLSNTPILTDYFVNDEYIKDINTDNPLGWQGKVANSYGELMKEIWSNQFVVVAPSKFKRKIGEFQPRFSGYQQQDSQELLSFLLDGLHEDLNRVKKKPPTDTVESNGRDDDVVANEAWETHMKRNQSVIVDHIQGQYKSTVTCPDCPRVSITFDPYMSLSLPLPTVKDKVQKMMLISNDTEKDHAVLVAPKVPKLGSVKDLKAVVQEVSGLDPDNQVVCDVWNHKIYKILENNDNLCDIRESDDIVIYEVPPTDMEEIEKYRSELPDDDERRDSDEFAEQKEGEGETPDTRDVPICVIHQKLRESYSGSMYSSGRPENFGLAMVINLPANTNIPLQVIKNKIRKVLEPFLSRGALGTDNSEPYKLMNLDQRGTRCAVCSWAKSCDGCEVPEYLNIGSGDDTTISLLWEHENISVYREEYFRKPTRHASAKRVRMKGMRSMSVDSATNVSGNSGGNMMDISNGDSDDEANDQEDEPLSKPISLNECFELFTEKEVLSASEAWYCRHCKLHKQATKQIKIWSTPEILIVHLKRFQVVGEWREKLDTLVDFPLDGLNLRPWMAGVGVPVYDLYAVSNHFGGLGGGHYTAYAKNLVNNEWYHFDDNTVSKVSPDEVKSNSAYVLYYRRRQLQRRHSDMIPPHHPEPLHPDHPEQTEVQ